ncbi:MAG TPA: hypothetical protein VF402_06230 [Asticcacaulis sp.]|jgi:hypothetical protein
MTDAEGGGQRHAGAGEKKSTPRNRRACIGACIEACIGVVHVASLLNSALFRSLRQPDLILGHHIGAQDGRDNARHLSHAKYILVIENICQ